MKNMSFTASVSPSAGPDSACPNTAFGRLGAGENTPEPATQQSSGAGSDRSVTVAS